MRVSPGLLAAVVLLRLMPVAAAADSMDFAGEVRLLLVAQDAMAAGHPAAVALQRSLIEQIERTFGGDRRPEATARNLLAAVNYVLSGGPPAISEALAKDEQADEGLRRLIAGALHFKRNEHDEAWRLLAAIDATSLPPETAGRVALVQSMIGPADDHGRRNRMLRLAANLMPGTLVEESALRRLIHATATQGDQRGFWQATDRYFRRFRKSIFLRSYLAEFTGDVTGMEARKVGADRQHLDLVLVHLPQDVRRGIYLSLAQSSVREGLWSLARFAAERARRLSVPSSHEWQRSALYATVSSLFASDPSIARDRLLGLDSRILPVEDRLLLAAAVRVSELIGAEHGPAGKAGTSPDDPADAVPAVAMRAEKSLTAAQSLLEVLDEDRH